MSPANMGPLVPEDELFIHQIVDTFATVSQSERSWTEKLWASAMASDGSLQVDLGLGLYPNRGVMDGFAGISRGTEQWTVRATRELQGDTRTRLGPITYEVIEPMQRVRFALAANDVVPISFEWEFAGAVPAHLEERELKRSADGRRIDSDIMRFHHTGTASGWASVDGVRTEMDTTWVAARDRSWGVRYMIGTPQMDLPRVPRAKVGGSLTIWSPVLCTRPDGSRYALHLYYHSDIGPGRSHTEFQGAVEHPDGTRDFLVALAPRLDFDQTNRRLLGGTLDATMADGSSRPLTITAVSDTGFHLGAGKYFSFDGEWHGQWDPRSREPLVVAGEHIADCSQLEAAKRLHQIRDCVVRIDDPVGNGVGYGTAQTIAIGSHPGSNLGDEGSFV